MGFTMSFLSPAPPLGGVSPPHGAFQEHAAHVIEWSMALSANGSLGTCIPKVFPHSSTPLSRRTATQERRLLGVGSTAWFGRECHPPRDADPMVAFLDA